MVWARVMAGGWPGLEVRGDGTRFWLDMGDKEEDSGREGKSIGQVRDAQETEIEKGVAGRLECCRGVSGHLQGPAHGGD